MKYAFTVLMLGLVVLSSSAYGGELEWPSVTREAKPWTRWWWLGSIGDAQGLTEQMQEYADAGLGGLEITPIYGVRGEEKRFVGFLSPQWVANLQHTLNEADRLGMGVDLATGTGWPFGGPWIDNDLACRNCVRVTYKLSGARRLAEPIEHTQKSFIRSVGDDISLAQVREPISTNQDLQSLALEQVRFRKKLPLVALVALSKTGNRVTLTDRVGADGRLDWEAPPGDWTIHALFQGWHGKLVERAGPGGEGNVIDHFSRRSLEAYLKRFDEALTANQDAKLRAYFNDSYEVDDGVGDADWTPRLFDEFLARKGYDLRDEVPALFGDDAPDRNARVLCDYREVISGLLLDEFTRPWQKWAESRSATTRNQSHGSPANILDLYAASGIPETEGTDRIQFTSAASAAHVTGKRLVGAEAATWLDEHFLATLEQTKQSVDHYFLGGVNHIVYHGTPYSPSDAPWPGWLFYASVHYGVTNSFWDHFPALNQYVARCQSLLQQGGPDSDILLYFPIHDRWSQTTGRLLDHFDGSAEGTTARVVAEELLASGRLYDFISDLQLRDADVDNGVLVTEGARYQAIVIPPCKYVPLETLEQLNRLAEQGAKLVLCDSLPITASGLGSETRDAAFAGQLQEARDAVAAGHGRVQVGSDLNAMLELAGVRRESLVNQGLDFVRRRMGDGHVYFVANRSDTPFDGMVAPAVEWAAVAIFDPQSGDAGVAATDEGGRVRLQLAPWQSCILRTFPRPVRGAEYPYLDPDGQPIDIACDWSLKFVAGGPSLPADRETRTLRSWPEFKDDEASAFSGTCQYTTRLDLPVAGAERWLLDLGDVRESAAVTLNGQRLATLISAPYRIAIPSDLLKAEDNVLVVEVANLMANRIAYMDRRDAANGTSASSWKRFYNVNMPPKLRQNRGDRRQFTAAGWEPLPSGLLGPVTLTPLRSAAQSD